MPINYKFIAVDKHQKTEMKHDQEIINDTINYEQVKQFFLNSGKDHGITEDDLINTKFIINNSQNMSLNEDENYPINKDETKVIFVFTVEKDTRVKLLELFSNKGYIPEKKANVTEDKPSENIVKPIPEEDIKITDEIIRDSNKKTLELFGDNDFKILLGIYKRNPDIFKTFSSYVCNGDVIINSFDKLKGDTYNYENELEQIRSLNLSLSDDLILDALDKNNGHLNLSLRYLLYKIDNSNIEKAENKDPSPSVVMEVIE